MKGKIKILTNGIIRENPVWILLLGTCPTLATTSTAISGVGMGIALLAVLTCSNTAISALKGFIPNKVRIPAFIVIISGFVTVVNLVVQAFSPSLYNALGIFLPLIVVNCIILARAEAFASKNKVFDSLFDGLGMGLGFTVALFVLGTIREMLGQGTWFGIRIIPEHLTISIFSSASGGFLAFSILIALFSGVNKDKNCHECRACNGGKTK